MFVTVGGIRQRGDMYSGGSYGSNSDPRQHFGLGASAAIEKVEVYWPSGRKETFSVPGVDRLVRLVEGEGVVEK